MGFFSRLGNKLSKAYDVGSRLGMKALGTASRVGHKIGEVGHSVVGAIKESPFGAHPYLMAATNVADRVLGAVDKGTALADKFLEGAKQVDSVVGKVRSKLEKPVSAPVDAGLQKHSSGQASGSLQEAKVHMAPQHRQSTGRFG